MTTFIITAIILWVLFAIFKSLAKKFGGFNVFGFTTICLAFILVAVSEDEVAVVSEDEVAVSNVEEKVLQHCHNTLQTGKTFCSYAFRDNNYRIWKRRAELKAKDEAARKRKAKSARKQQQRSVTTPEYSGRPSEDHDECMYRLRLAYGDNSTFGGSASYAKRKEICDEIY